MDLSGIAFIPVLFLPFWSFYQLTRFIDGEQAHWLGYLGCFLLLTHPIKCLHPSTWFFMCYICYNYERRPQGQFLFYLVWILTALDFIFFLLLPAAHTWSQILRYMIRAPLVLGTYHYLRVAP